MYSSEQEILSTDSVGNINYYIAVKLCECYIGVEDGTIDIISAINGLKKEPKLIEKILSDERLFPFLNREYIKNIREYISEDKFLEDFAVNLKKDKQLEQNNIRFKGEIADLEKKRRNLQSSLEELSEELAEKEENYKNTIESVKKSYDTDINRFKSRESDLENRISWMEDYIRSIEEKYSEEKARLDRTELKGLRGKFKFKTEEESILEIRRIGYELFPDLNLESSKNIIGSKR